MEAGRRVFLALEVAIRRQVHGISIKRNYLVVADVPRSHFLHHFTEAGLVGDWQRPAKDIWARGVQLNLESMGENFEKLTCRNIESSEMGL